MDAGEGGVGVTDPHAPELIGLVRHPLTGRYRLWVAGEDVPGDAAARYVRADIADEMLAALKEVHSMFGANDIGTDLATRIAIAIAKAKGGSE